MKVFISSVMHDFDDMRAAAVAAVNSLGYEPITAETFAAGVSSPRVACLQGVREADVVVLILGAEYGAAQRVSGLSATHEEYREAKDHRPVIAFVQEGVEREPAQQEFVREVQDWSGGLFRGGFRTADQLRDSITQALHRFELSAAAAPVDTEELRARALELIPREDRNYMRHGGPLLHLAVAGGPAQTILRPVEIERPELARALLRDATYGESPIFDPAHGADSTVRNGSLELTQETGAAIVLNERGAVRLSVPIAGASGMMGALIEENVADAIELALAQAAEILAKVDETERLSRIVVAAGISSNGFMGWRTRREDEASPNSMTMSSMFRENGREPVHFQPPDRARASLSFDRARMVEDLVALIRRQWC
jgi:hypothetical protein